MSNAWEPQIGQRVRLHGDRGCPLGTHGSMIADGEMGRVVEFRPDVGGSDHPYRVRLDNRDVLPADLGWSGGPWCSVSEMELLEDGGSAA